MNELTLNLDIHNKYGFYQIENGIKCEFMELDGYSMRCNQDIKNFKRGIIYPIHDNSNDYIIYDNNEARIHAIKNKNIDKDNHNDWLHLEYGFYEFIPVEWFENGIFTLINERIDKNE